LAYVLKRYRAGRAAPSVRADQYIRGYAEALVQATDHAVDGSRYRFRILTIGPEPVNDLPLPDQNRTRGSARRLGVRAALAR
jgi:hypothetical protein